MKNLPRKCPKKFIKVFIYERRGNFIIFSHSIRNLVAAIAKQRKLSYQAN
jgi:hypothetical protein